MAKILVVDDSALSRRVLRTLLESAGHQVIEANDGTTAIERYFLNRPSLVILDLTMPDMHGIDVLKKLRALDPGARVVVVTADTQKATREAALTEGALDVVHKPLSRRNVLPVIEAALGDNHDDSYETTA